MDEALAYIDREYDEECGAVDALIEREMKRFDPRDYLARFDPVPELFKDNPLLRAEMERVAKKEPLEAIDLSRYQVPLPAVNMRKNPDAWQKAIDNAASQLEHQRVRMENLMLLASYGVQSWRVHADMLGALKTRQEKELKRIQNDAEEVNRERKLAQVEAEPALRKLEYQYYELVYKNATIARACDRLEKDVQAITQSLREAGELPEEKEGGSGDEAGDDMNTE